MKGRFFFHVNYLDQGVLMICVFTTLEFCSKMKTHIKTLDIKHLELLKENMEKGLTAD